MTIAEIDERNATGSFHGLRVLDFSTTIAGPHCTRMLADMGAEVIKIEPAEGETMRIRPPVRNGCQQPFRSAQRRQEKRRPQSEIAGSGRRRSSTGERRRHSGGEFPSRRHAAAEARLRLLAAAQSEARLLFDLRLRPDRTVGGVAGLCAGHSRRVRLRHGASRLPARKKPAGLLRHLSRRHPDRRLCLRRHFGRALPAPAHRQGPAHRRVDAGIDAHLDAERSAERAIQSAAAEPADVRSGRDGGRLCDGGDRQRKDLSGPGPRRRPSRMGQRFPLCEICRPSRAIGSN